ncbi:hypothetical protein O6H91_18G029700 [Diphasiastrum complanatum]|uniref:Uncharacterized protein n=3 Tax=Diphasiastrum complanatum TaxID=34168 RepID=A0ACC2AZA1_DIPCM|nr:hypothetical protein O6H91_18G029700 [Diphasiastrum complanatum]
MTTKYIGPLHALLIKAGLADGTDHAHVVAICLFVTLLCACIILGHLLEENRWMNESITAIILGCFTGSVVLITSGGTNSHILQFNEELFFIYLLPPICFNAGFQVKKKQFFENFAGIMLYGVVGVFISFAVITAGCRYIFPAFNLGNFHIKDFLALGAIFSATDSVCTLQVLSQDETPFLYSLVFGEGVVNDATSVVLFRAVQKLDTTDINGLTALSILGSFLYLFFTSTALGVVTGLLSAYIIKTLYFGRHSTDREIALMTLMAYLSYTIAELFYLSGILTVFFCGIVMSHYTWHNVTESSRITSKHTFATMSFIAETFIFLYVGMDTLDVDKWKKANERASFSIAGILLLLVLLGRAAFVFPLSALSNYLRRTPGTRINYRQQIIIWWAGLIRGAVSIALAFNEFTTSGTSRTSEHATIITSTIMIVLFSTVVFGMATKPLISAILPHHLRSFQSDASEPPSPKDLASDLDLQTPLLSLADKQNVIFANGMLRRSSLTMLLQAPTSTIHKMWRKFDNSYMRPVFGGRGFVPLIKKSPRALEVRLLPETDLAPG